MKNLLNLRLGIGFQAGLLTVLLMLAGMLNPVKAQYFTMDGCSITLGSNLYTIYSTSTANATGRHASIYPASQLAPLTGQIIEALYLERTTASGSLSGPANLKLYLKEVTESEWPAGALDWATAITGATLVYDADPGTVFGTSDGWKKFLLDTNFPFSGTQNLALFIEYIGPTTTSSSIAWTYEYGNPCISTTNSNTTRYSNNTTGTPATSLATTNYRRPYLAFDVVLACGYPFDVISSNPTSNSIDVQWTAPSTAPANGYEYYLSTDPTVPTGATSASGTTAAGVTNIAGLSITPDVANYFWVRSVCNAGVKSPWSAGISFFGLPSNDDCENAIMLTQSSTCTATSGSTAGATASIQANPCTGEADDDVWFSFEATQQDAKIDISNVVAVEGTSTVDYYQVYSGDCSNLTPLMCITGSTGIVGNLNPGEIYYIRVFSSLNTSRISFDICVTELAAAPATCPSFTAPAAGATVSELPLIDWATSTNASGYYLFLDQNNPPTTLYATTYNNGEADFQITNPLPAGTYYWYVQSFNSLGEATCTATPRSFTVVAAPANDDAADAIALTLNADQTCTTVMAGATSGATQSLDPDPSCSASGINDDVWYSFVATSTYHVLSLTGITGGTTALALYEGTVGNLSFVTGGCASSTTTVNVYQHGLTIGNTYYLRVYSTSALSATSTTFNVCVQTPPAPPSNDEAINAISVPVNPDMNCTSTIAGTTQSASQSLDAAPSCSATGSNDDVWYKFTATHNRHLLSVEGATSTSAIAVYSGTVGSLVFMTGNCASTNVLATGLNPAEEYFVRIYSTSTTITTYSNFTLCISTLPPPPVNDELAGAIAIATSALEFCITPTHGTTFSASSSAITPTPSCSAAGINDDVWYMFTATSSAHSIVISNETSTLAIAVYEETSPGVYTQLGCASSTVSVAGLTIGTTYYLRVYSTSSVALTSSEFDICVATTPTVAPANDEATGAVPLTVGAGCTTPIYSNTLATQSATEVFPSCKGTAGFGTVWYSFVAPASGFVKISTNYNVGSMGADTRMAVYSATDVSDYSSFVSLACDDDNGTVVASRSVIYLNDLIGGETYYIQVSGHLVSTIQGTFCITVDEFNSTMLSNNGTSCTTGQSQVSNYHTYPGALSLTDADGNLRAIVKQNTPAASGTASSTYAVSMTMNTNPVRQDGRGEFYLDRNFSITNTTATNINVKLFFTDAELAALTAADPSITLSNLGVTKVDGSSCSADFNDPTANAIKLNVVSSGSFAGTNWIEINTPDFSNFFINKANVLLPIHVEFFNGAKQTNTRNMLSWKLNCDNNRSNTVILQRSSDQSVYTDIFTKLNTNDDMCSLNMSFMDEHAQSGMNYYRLKMVDADGRTTYSSIVAIYNSTKAFDIVTLTPNPVRSSATVTIASEETKTMQLVLVDITGKRVMQQQVHLLAGENRVVLATEKLAAGTYYVSGKTKDAVTKTVVLVKQ